MLLLSALCPHAAITFCMRYFGSYSGLQSSSSQPCALTVLPILPFWFAFVPEVNLGEVCDRSKDKPVVNPYLCGDKVYVDVSNSERPVLQNLLW